MKVALVVPNSKNKLTDSCPPFNLGYLAGYLRLKKPDVTVTIIDGMTGVNVEQELWQFQPDIVGVTATSILAPSAYVLGDNLKTRLPHVYTVMGGVHASAMPNEALQHFDCVVVGEGEQALVDIVSNMEEGTPLQGIVMGKLIMNLDDVPIPAYDLMGIDKYLGHDEQMMEQGKFQLPGLISPFLIMITSRGCIYSCPFCYNSNRTYPTRWFSAKRVVDELEFLLEHYNINSFFFTDDEFLINQKRLAEIGRLLKERDLNIVWGCQARVNSMNLETLQLAKKMGCVLVIPGFESMSPRILKYLKSDTTSVEANRRALMNAEKAGLMVNGNFIVGTPTETLQEMNVTFDWYLKNGTLKNICMNSMVPFPGTGVHKLCLTQKLIPEQLDYTRLACTNDINQTYLVDSAVDKRSYSRFLYHAKRIAWVLSSLRCGKTFSSLIRDLHLWYVVVFHPVKTLRMLQCSLKHQPITC